MFAKFCSSRDAAVVGWVSALCFVLSSAPARSDAPASASARLGAAFAPVGAPGSSDLDREAQDPAPKVKDPSPKAKDPDPKANEKTDDSRRQIEIPPDVQRQIDELLERDKKKGGKPKPLPTRPKRDASRRTPRSGAKVPVKRPSSIKAISAPAGSSRAPASPPRSGKSRSKAAESVPGKSDASTGPTTVINIPAIEEDVSPEERTYSFSIKDGSYAQLLAGVNRQTGLAILGDAPKDGKVTFVTEEMLSFTEMLNRVRMLLFNYKPHDPYWLRRHATHLKVVRVTDLYRELGIDRMFKSIEDFRAAGLPDEELALVIYTPKSGSVARLNMIRDFMPDYVRIAPMDGRNAITIFALVRDIEKYMQLKDIFVQRDGGNDPRTLEVISVEHIKPSLAWGKLQSLMSIAGDSRARPKGGSRGRARDPSPLDNMPEPTVSVVPEDAQGVLIVRAMQDKIDEMKRLLPYVDVDTTDSFEPVIIELEHASAEEVIPAIQQILAATRPQSSEGATPKRSARSGGKKKRGKKGGTAVTTGGITLIAHPRDDAIIVIASEEDTQRVRELIPTFDTDDTVGPVHIELTYADPVELTAVLTQVILGAPAGTKGVVSRFQIVPHPSGNGLWFTGTEDDLAQVRDLVAVIDMPEEEVSLHVIRLENQLPSFVADILTQYDVTGGVASPGAKLKSSKKKRGSRAKSKPRPSGKFTPDDEQKRLFVLCSETKWQEYLPIIAQLETEMEPETPLFTSIPIVHIDPQEAVNKLKGAFVVTGKGGAAASKLRIEAMDGAVLVVNATPDELDDMRELLAVYDQPGDEIVKSTFEIRHASIEVILGAIRALVLDESIPMRSGARAPKGDRKGSASSPTSSSKVTLVPMGRKLVVRAPREKMDEIAELIAEFDIEDGATELRVYDGFGAGADISKLADTLRTLIGVPSPGPKRQKGAAASSPAAGLLVVAQPEAARIIVMAPADEFDLIEQRIELLRTDTEVQVIETAFVLLEHALPYEVVELVEPLLEMKVGELIATGVLRGAAGFPAATAGKPKKPGGARRAKTGALYFLSPDARNGRIVIAGPKLVLELAKGLIAQFDTEADGGEPIVRTVQLHNASAPDMVKTIRSMMGAPTGPAGAKGAKGGRGPGNLAMGDFTVIAAPGNTAVVLRGTPEAVDLAAEWVAQLDDLPGNSQKIKVYALQHANVGQLVDLIMATVGKPTAPKGKKGRRPKPRGGVQEDEPWVTKIKRSSGEVYLEADLIANTMVVAAPAARLAEVDAIVAKFDTEDDARSFTETRVPSEIFPLTYKDPLDAAFDLENVLEAMWDGDEIPRVEAALWGDFLVVEYPDESRFGEIEELIRKYVDVPEKGAGQSVRKSFVAPQGMSPREVALLLQMKQPNIQFDLNDISQKRIGVSAIEQVRPPAKRVSPCVLPGAFVRMSRAPAMAVVMASEDEDPKDRAERDDVLQAASQALMGDETDEGDETEEPDAAAAAAEAVPVEPRQKVKVYYDLERQAIIVEGAPELMDEIEDSMKEIKEEIEDFTGPPDIRIYRVKYLDVFTATDIINEMFNATRQQMQQVQRAQNMARQQQRRQQQQQQRQQQQAAKKGQQQPQRPGQRQQQQVNMPQLPPTAVRVYPNPRDRTLILRADPSQFPALLELLATIDQPQPVESKFRTFTLEKLNAVEVEDVLKSMLGLDTRPTRQRRPTAGARRGAGARPGAVRTAQSGGHLPESIMAEMVTGAGKLGVDPRDIKISSNEEANTILVMAPEAALDYIGERIKQLESHDIPERVWKDYELKHADAAGIVEYLQSRYDDSGVTGKGGRGRKGARGGARGAAQGLGRRALNAPTFVAYTRLNQVAVQATAEQFEEIDALIVMIDVPDAEGEWQTITLSRADAAVVADTLTQMFSKAGGQRSQARRGPGGKPSAVTGGGPKFIGNDGGKTVFYAAADNLREPILAVVDQLEAESPTTTPRVIQLTHAVASSVAEAIEAAYGTRRTQRRGGRAPRGGGGGASAGTGMTITAHDPTKRLFVLADDKVFAEVEAFAKMLDEPSEPAFAFRVFPLKHADAKKIHEQMKSLMVDYMRQLGRDGGEAIEPFSVEVDENANALIVLGSEAIFGFIEKNLAKVDIPANARSPKVTRMMVLKNADAVEVAQNINRLWGGRNLPAGEEAPQAEANRALNALVLKGTQAQVDEIKKDFVDPLEENAPPSLSSETFTLEHAEPDAVADSINQIFEDKKRAFQALGREANVPPITFTVVATPDLSTKQVVVQAGEENMELVRARVAEMDTPENAIQAASSIRIYTLKYADPTAVANIINQWARARQSGAGRAGRPRAVVERDMVNAAAEPQTLSVVVTASEANHLIVKDLVDGLDDETHASRQRKQHVLPVKHADAAELANQLTQVYRGAGNRSRGDAGPTFVGDPGSNAIVANINSQEREDVERLVGLLDVKPEADRALEVHVITLVHADADSVARTLDQIFVRTAPRRQGNVPPPVTVSALQGSKAVLIKCKAKDYDDIAAVVAQLDSKESIGGEVRVVTLKYGDATEMQRALQEAYKKPGARSNELVGGLRLSALAQSNAIVISGSPEEVERVEARIREMDEATEKGAVPQLIVLEHAKPRQVVPTLLEMFSGQLRGGNRRGQDPPVITGNDAMNGIFVKASPGDFAAIESVIKALDTPELAEKPSYRIIQIAQGVNITDLADKVESAVNEGAAKQYSQTSSGRRGRGGRGGGRGGSSGFGGSGGFGRRTQPSVMVTPDPRTNSLIVAGTSALFDDVEELARAMEQMGPSGGRGTRIIKLVNQPVEDIQRVIDQLTQRDQGSRRSGRARSGSSRSGRGSSRAGRSGGSRGGGSRPVRRPGRGRSGGRRP